MTSKHIFATYGKMFNNTTHFKIYLLFYSASLWDIILKNEKDTSTFSNSDLSMFNNIYLIKYDGCIYFSRELLSNVQCPMNLEDFPHDVQNCFLIFSSYWYGIDKVNLTSSFDSLPLSSSSFDIIMDSKVHTRSFNNGEYKHEYAEFVVTITLKRKLGFYMYQVFL